MLAPEKFGVINYLIKQQSSAYQPTKPTSLILELSNLIFYFMVRERQWLLLATQNCGRHPQEGCLGTCSGAQYPDEYVRGWSVGCTIGVSETSASRVQQSRNVLSGVSRTKKVHFQAGVLYELRRSFVFFLMSDKHERRYVSVHVACGFTLKVTSKPGPPLAARNSNKQHARSNTRWR